MASSKLNNPYEGCTIILTTKHAKSIAIAPPFLDRLGAKVIEHVVDTDRLGTFSGEVERVGSALDCARKKCEWTFEQLDHDVQFALASEGSFGPHPLMPFMPCDHELLYFIDRRHDFHLYLSLTSEKTNYRTGSILSLDKLFQFAEQVHFPSHALILRPNNRQTTHPIYKGIDSYKQLEEAFNQCHQFAEDGAVWVETDMRAQYNPSRMKVIGELACMLSDRLTVRCPACASPGWGKVRTENGLPCSCCGLKTELIKAEIHGCVKCEYEETRARPDGKNEAEPGQCQYCNP